MEEGLSDEAELHERFLHCLSPFANSNQTALSEPPLYNKRLETQYDFMKT